MINTLGSEKIQNFVVFFSNSIVLQFDSNFPISVRFYSTISHSESSIKFSKNFRTKKYLKRKKFYLWKYFWRTNLCHGVLVASWNSINQLFAPSSGHFLFWLYAVFPIFFFSSSDHRSMCADSCVNFFFEFHFFFHFSIF